MEIQVNNCTVILSDIDSIISHKKKLVYQITHLKEKLQRKEDTLLRFETYLYQRSIDALVIKTPKTH